MRYRMNYTLYKRGKYWYYRTYTPEGERTCGRTTGQTVKAKAILYCDELMREGNLVARKDITFMRYAEGFFDAGSVWYVDRCGETVDGSMPLAYGTLRVMRSTLGVHLLPYWGKYLISKITVSEVKKFRMHKLSEGSSIAHIQVMVSCLKIILDWARLDNLIASNPCAGLRSLRDNRGKKDAFSLDDILCICRQLSSSPRVRLLFIVGVCTGMRASEMCAIRLETINDGYVEVRDQRIMIRGSLELVPTKTKARRFIPISRRLREMLVSGAMEDGFCFKLHDKNLANDVIRVNRQERNLSLHSTRRFFNTYMLAHNVPPIKVSAVMGHSAGATKMQDLYSNWKPEHFPEILKEQELLLDTILAGINNEA